MQNIGQNTIKEFSIAVPPASEASLILNRIDQQVALFNHCLQKVDQKIMLLREHRTAAVTGKIDVRNWKPDQSESCMEASA